VSNIGLTFLKPVKADMPLAPISFALAHRSPGNRDSSGERRVLIQIKTPIWPRL
jgi:hypothetical protein